MYSTGERMNWRRVVMFLVIALMTSFNFSRGAKNSIVQQVEVSIDGSGGDGVAYADGPIDWEDFRATPDSASYFSAMIYCGIGIKYDYIHRKEGTVVSVKLRPYMNQSKSWYKDSLINDH